MVAAVRVGSFVFYQWWQCTEKLWHAKFAMRELKHFCDAFFVSDSLTEQDDTQSQRF